MRAFFVRKVVVLRRQKRAKCIVFGVLERLISAHFPGHLLPVIILQTNLLVIQLTHFIALKNSPHLSSS